MAGASVQFAVATHVSAVLAFYYGTDMTSAQLARSVNTEPTFVRKVVSKLAKAGIVTTSRGKGGKSSLAKPPQEITLRDVYRASGPISGVMQHTYPVLELCPVSKNIKQLLSTVQIQVEQAIEEALEKITLQEMAARVSALEIEAGVPCSPSSSKKVKRRSSRLRSA